MSKFPILILVPHGGYRIPEEIAGLVDIDESDCFLSADTGANEIFSLDTAAVLTSHVSRLFVDIDRSPYDLPPRSENGVIKIRSALGASLYGEDFAPNAIAIANLVRRYHHPFTDAAEKIVSSGEVKLILECHTVSAIGGRYAADRDIVRPIVSIQHITERSDGSASAHNNHFASALLAACKKFFPSNDSLAAHPFELIDKPIRGYLSRLLSAKVPYLRLNLSRGLFMGSEYFSAEYSKIDSHRIDWVRTRMNDALERFAAKELR